MSETIEKKAISVESVIFFNREEGFCIFRASIKNSGERLVVKGHVGGIEKGEELVIWGNWEKHPKYGDQVKITNFRYPEIGGREILTFLKSGFVKGIRESTAKAIWERFGEDTERILNREPKRLLEVNGIGKKKLETIKQSWRENRGKQEALVRFQEWGIGPMTVQKIFRRWPEKPLETVEQNPYLLAWEIDGVGFSTADRIALNSGVSENSTDRIRAGIAYTLQEASSREGHAYLDREELAGRVKKMLWPEGTSAPENGSRRIYEQIDSLVGERELVDREGKIYGHIMYQTEQSLVYHLERLMGGVRFFPYSIPALIENYETGKNIQFDGKQREAIGFALNSKVCIITGGPGTGKTTIVNAILELARQGGLKNVALVAPTGRAAKRLQESTGCDAGTIHRYLGYSPSEGFQFNSQNQVSDELVICDEASMLDMFLAKNLIEALPKKTRLVLVGDVHQLPSVGAGNVLRDCINSGVMPVTELDTIHRREEGSWITRNAHAVKNGNTKAINLSNNTKDFFWEDLGRKFPDLSPADRSVELKKRVLQAMQGLQKAGCSAEQVQVLTPVYKGPVGVATLNREFQEMLNPAAPDKAEVSMGYKLFRVGDRVMQLKNDYSKEIYNGDQGWIWEINRDDSIMWIEFDGKLKEYSFLDMDQLVLSYACTVHKSQGCEFPVVIMPVTVSHYIMLQRNLLYTGITRAKQICILFGEKKALGIAVKNDSPVARNTRVKEMLVGLAGKGYEESDAGIETKRSLCE